MITSDEMKELETNSGISTYTLMENAGRGVAQIIREKFDLKSKKILVVCYHGNNGGDGFVAARHLCDDCEVDLLFMGEENKLKKDALANYKKADENNKIQFVNLDDDFEDYDIIIDAVFGTGVTGQIKEEIKAIINRMNESKAIKISIDIPSGIDPDTGAVSDVSVNPDLVIALHDIKKGAEMFSDKTIVLDIGLGKKEII